MLSWPDFDIMSFGYSVNMYLCILGLAFFTAGLFLTQVIFTKLADDIVTSYGTEAGPHTESLVICHREVKCVKHM